MRVPLWAWLALSSIFLAMLALDLWVFQRKPGQISLRQAAGWSALWITFGLTFAGVIRAGLGTQAAGEYLAGFLIEYSLSIDNLFVFALILRSLAVPVSAQQRVLMFGVVGALIFRAIFILAGTALIVRLHWLLYGFGALLILTGIRMARPRSEAMGSEGSPTIRLIRRALPIAADSRSERLLVVENGRLLGTPLLVAVAAVASTDLLFAIDSVPAIFSITLNPFIVFSANAFALLGLRGLYFLLVGMLRRFVYLPTGIAILLVLLGIKMLAGDLYHVPIGLSLAAIVSILLLTIAASALADRSRSGSRVSTAA